MQIVKNKAPELTSGCPAQAIVRVGVPHPDLITRVLDWGAQGIMIPDVNSAEEVEKIVQAAHYAPRGQRGFSRTVRAYDYGLRPPVRIRRLHCLWPRLKPLKA